MAKDIQHILSGLLTASMLLMFCNMIKKDHIDPLLADIVIAQPTTANDKNVSTSNHNRSRGLMENTDPWGLNNTKVVLNPCWRKSTHLKSQESKGFIFVTLAYRPEYHPSQIANAVVVAKYLGATLVLPDLRRSEPRRKGKLGEIYDLNHFTASLDGRVALSSMDSKSADLPNQNAITVRVPNMVSKEFIKSNLEPIFKSTRSLRLTTYFPSNLEHNQDTMNPYACLGIYDTLVLRPELQESLRSMIATLRSLSSYSEERFVAVDYRLETMPGSRKCLHNPKQCFDAKEIAAFLDNIGFENDTTIYLTLNGWHASVEHFRNVFRNTFTKDEIFSANEKLKFLDNPELKRMVDFYISSTADVFVPTTKTPNVFSDNVVAMRIFTSKTQVLLPGNVSSSSSSSSSPSRVAKHYVPHNIAHKKHWAYSCFC